MSLLEDYVDLPGEAKEIMEPIREIVLKRGLRFIITDLPKRPFATIHADIVGDLDPSQFEIMAEDFRLKANLFSKTKHYDSRIIIYASYVLTKNRTVIELAYSPKARSHVDLDQYIKTGEITNRKLLEF
ncbi:MAG: hypothetical protein Q8R00_03490 [Candidatus Nanoarchaeia archaeon]|nr:hypothetical protein [Candidatus Nanoarchaeia archaeon]